MASQPVEFEPDLDGFVAFLTEEATKSEDEWLEDERATAIEFYNGEPFGDEEEGRSQIVTRDVAEVIDYMTVSLLRTMVSGDKVVELEYPETPQPAEPTPDGQPQRKPPSIAEIATLAVSREFYQGQDGYRFLHDWIKAGLLEKASTAKVCVEEQPPKRITGTIGMDELAGLIEQGAGVLEAAENGDGSITGTILMPQPPRFRDYVSPNEETCIAGDARDLDDDCAYLGFRMAKTLSQLAEMGFDTTDLSDDGSHNPSDVLSNARDRNITDFWRQGFNRQGANRKVWYFEEYSTYDLNGDGIAERIQSHRVGNQILRWAESGEYAIDEVEDQPGVVWCPFPMPHRIVGQSLADKVMDIQRTRSVLMRQGLDNLYQVNAPRMLVPNSAIGDNTIDDLLTIRPGGLVRYEGGQAPTPLTLPFAAQSAFEVMEVLAGEKESRTGITRLNQGLDADTLNKTATGTALMQAQGQQIEEYLARNFAEAFARLMLKKYRLMRQFGRPMQVIVDGETITTDPREWPDDMNVVVRVGLGSGRKDQRLQYRQMLLEIAQQAILSGSRVFNDTNIYNIIKGLIADASLGNVRELITDPDTLGPEAEKPDPAALKAQADSMIAAQKLDQDKAASQAEMMLKGQQMEIDAQLRQEESAAKITLMREEAAAKIELERQRATAEAAMNQQRMAFEQEMAREQMALQREQAEHKAEMDSLPKNRPGGDLDK